MITMRLMRFGTKKKPSYRIVVMDSRQARQSRCLDTIGHYNPMTDPAEVTIDAEKARTWLEKGVKPSNTVQSLLNKVGKPEKRAQDSKT
ncbi:MAG TPA: 30S ribosomal protein S16 [Candidatus Aminicenantes bacterium]|nr:30S ribosomal protein S16 [Acidobacteriota bacterium]HOI44023.1 30S ribosomal protein S16 [Candidatus Aminicenantes bacterium]